MRRRVTGDLAAAASRTGSASTSGRRPGGALRLVFGLVAALLATAGLIAAAEGMAYAAAVCPPVNVDTGCGTVITVTKTGATVASTGQGPYESADDTLVGVVNNSTIPIRKLALRSARPIFGFDGDGIDVFGIPGNAMDGTGYGGPNAYYTKIAPGSTAGTVNFIVPIAANGGTAYFSLEAAISSATSCQDVVNNSLSGPTGAGTTSIRATMTPNLGFSLAEAADACGFADIDWQQSITSLPLPSPFSQVGAPPATWLSQVKLSAPPAFFDPPAGGYRKYDGATGEGKDYPDNSYPFYYDPAGELATHQNTATRTLDFFDAPADRCLPGGSGVPCGGHTAASGFFGFTTHLVGVNSDRTVTDLGIGFSWKTTFNGTSGQIDFTKNTMPGDPGTGSGGVTVLSVQQTTSYQYDGVTVTAVNDVPVGNPTPTTTTLTASPTPARFGSRVTVTATVAGTGTSAPTGTVQFFLDGQTTPVADVPVSAGQASFATSGLGAGTHTITAAYGGDPSNLASTSPAISLVVATDRTLTGAVNGSVIVPSGSTVWLRNATVHGAVVIDAGGSVDIEGSTVSGPVGGRSPHTARVCGSTVAGTLSVTASAGFVLVGDPGDDACPSNVVRGALSLTGNGHGLDAIGNRVGGAIAISGNSGPGAFPGDVGPEVSGNTH